MKWVSVHVLCWSYWEPLRWWGQPAAWSPMELLIVKMSILITSEYPAPACLLIKLIHTQKIALSGVNYWKSSTGTIRQTWKAKQSYAYTNNLERERCISILDLMVMFEPWYVFNLHIFASITKQACNFKKTKFSNLRCRRMLLNC